VFRLTLSRYPRTFCRRCFSELKEEVTAILHERDMS
jgi:hypothetical protein